MLSLAFCALLVVVSVYNKIQRPGSVPIFYGTYFWVKFDRLLRDAIVRAGITFASVYVVAMRRICSSLERVGVIICIGRDTRDVKG